jgi:hypothetical protein
LISLKRSKQPKTTLPDRDQAQEGGFIGKEACDAGAAFEFLIHPFQRVGGAHPFLVRARQGEHREALRQVFLQPRGELGGAGAVVDHDLLEALIGGGAAGAVKNAANGARHFSALIQTRDIGLGVLLEMKPAALPGHGGEDGGAGGLQAGVIVADNELDATETARQQAFEEVAPVDFRLAQRGTDAQERAFAGGADAQSDEDGAIEQLAVLPDFFVAGVQDEIGKGAEGALAPLLKFGVEALGAFAGVGGTDAGAAELFNDGGDAAGGDALDIHFGKGEFEGLFGAEAFLEGGGIERHVAADLGDVEGDGAEAGEEGFVFEAVGVAFAGVGAFVRLGLEGVGTLDAHGLVDEQAEALGQAIRAVFGDELQDGIQEIRLGAVGHVMFNVGCVLRHPNRKPAWPALDQFFARGASLPLRGSAALGSLRSPSLRLTPEGQGRREGRQFTERLLHRRQRQPSQRYQYQHSNRFHSRFPFIIQRIAVAGVADSLRRR